VLKRLTVPPVGRGVGAGRAGTDDAGTGDDGTLVGLTLMVAVGRPDPSSEAAEPDAAVAGGATAVGAAVACDPADVDAPPIGPTTLTDDERDAEDAAC
jgi:hypothetical protein